LATEIIAVKVLVIQAKNLAKTNQNPAKRAETGLKQTFSDRVMYFCVVIEVLFPLATMTHLHDQEI
jgi:hypothetical protein